MGLFHDIFGSLWGKTAGPRNSNQFWSTFTAYSPVFTSFDGGIYEQELTRAAVERFAVSCSKLKPNVVGNESCKPRIRRAIATSPNRYMTWSTLLSRAATILKCDTTCAIVPQLDEYAEEITGFWPLRFETADIVQYAGEPWVRFYLANGETVALELKYVCFLTRFQYESDFFGDGNVLDNTMKLIDAQNQAEDAAIKNGAKIRFIGKAAGVLRPEDVDAKRQKFAESNLSTMNSTGLMVYDNTFENVQQINPTNFTISSDEMERIEKNVYTYFGTNEDILQNHYTEDIWGAYYEGEIEPFAVQLGEGLTHMCFTVSERKRGNRIEFSANRLEYASNASKRNMVRDMLDRCVMTLNEAREVLQLPPIEGGDVFIARGEYYMLDKNLKLIYSSGGIESGGEAHPDPASGSYAEKDFDLGGDDDIYNDTDGRGDKEVDE